MSLTIDTTYSHKTLLPSFNEDDAKIIKKKGWSFSYVYNFSEIRDIYLVLKQKRFTTLKDFTQYCLDIQLPTIKTKWNKRRILEHLNALKNFDIIDTNYEIKQNIFIGREIGSSINKEDLQVFHNIYFTYFRFKEIFAWFINPTVENRENYINQLSKEDIEQLSKPLFSFSEKSRFTDSFFFELKDNPRIYFIDSNTSEDLMRFWDVFIKWGTVLGILEKFNLRNLDIKTITNKGIACTYALNKKNIDFNLLSYIKKNYNESYIYLPTLILNIAISFRISVEDVQEIVIEQYKLYKDHLSFERTSEIFVKKLDIKEGDKIFFPKYKDSYVSHLIVRK